ncbi:hypothetical protein LY474_04850 [Myxococcus stipitatus]|uniref:hypothetical protein n=1 Tax=Myxococcus stipitatus TaxID=83455 RepID=UPI001F455444|nr:hypothetical protein [Myxococcus stipitatus]MCE9667138.1 hypothetical protein [Myxococcus stipitatus]
MSQGVGPDLDLWLLASDGSRSYEVLRFSSAGAPPQRLRLPPERRDFQYIQPLPRGELLLVESRCATGTEPARNAVIYSPEGHLLREFTLGDGIQDVQTTSDGRLWVSYFDEGVIGNCGWGTGDPLREPIGRSGLVLFDSRGQLLSEYDARAVGTDVIIDCYALNVAADEETWIYFYTDFPLVRLRGGGRPEVWNTRVAGASALAVSPTHVLFGGSYEARSRFELFTLHSAGRPRMMPVGSFLFEDPEGMPWQPTWMCGRGPWLYGGEGTRVFRIELDSLVASLRKWH